MNYVLRTRVSDQKETWMNEFMQILRRVFKDGEVLVHNVKRMNLKMLCTAFYYNLHQLMTLKIKVILKEQQKLSLKSKNSEPEKKKQSQINKAERKIWPAFPRRKKMKGELESFLKHYCLSVAFPTIDKACHLTIDSRHNIFF